MAWDLFRAASGVQCGHSSAKFVLMQMALLANDQMKCAVSIDHFANITEQDRKTVIKNLKRLADAGLITKTAQRGGKCKQLPVYFLHLNVPRDDVFDDPDAADFVPDVPDFCANTDDLTSTKNGTPEPKAVPKTVQPTSTKNGTPSGEVVPFFPKGCTTFSEREYQKRYTSNRSNKERVVNTLLPAALIEEYAAALKSNGVGGANAGNSVLQQLVESGVDLQTVLAAVDEAKRSLRDRPCNLGYIVAILRRWRDEQAVGDLRGLVAPSAQSAGRGFNAAAYNMARG